VAGSAKQITLFQDNAILAAGRQRAIKVMDKKNSHRMV
jgi:hypothetical protein